MFQYKIITHDESLARKLNYIAARIPGGIKKMGEETSHKLTLLAKSKVAPRKSGTGNLKKSIKGTVRPGEFSGSWVVEITAGGNLYRTAGGKHGGPQNYPFYQEHGFTPHLIHKSMWMGKTWTPDGDFAYVSKYTPFMRPSINQFINRDLPLLAQNFLKKLIR